MPIVSKVMNSNIPATAQVLDYHGAPFQPKVWINIGFSTTSGVSSRFGFGAGVFSESQNDATVQGGSNDTTDPSAATRAASDARSFIEVSIGADTVAWDCATRQPLSDGFVLNWITSASAQNLRAALFAGDIQAKIVPTILLNGTGNYDTTGVGFQPKAIIFFHSRGDSTNGVTNANVFGIGLTDEMGRQWASTLTDNDNVIAPAITQNGSGMISGYCTGRTSFTSPFAFSTTHTLVRMIPDGFTLNSVISVGSGGVRHFALCLGGNIQSYVGNFQQPTTTGFQTITGVPFEPKFVLTLSTLKTVATDGSANARLGLGFCDEYLTQTSSTSTIQDSVTPANTARHRADNVVFSAITDGGTPTVQSQAALIAYKENGFILNWTTADATARDIAFLALA